MDEGEWKVENKIKAIAQHLFKIPCQLGSSKIYHSFKVMWKWHLKRLEFTRNSFFLITTLILSSLLHQVSHTLYYQHMLPKEIVSHDILQLHPVSSMYCTLQLHPVRSMYCTC